MTEFFNLKKLKSCREKVLKIITYYIHRAIKKHKKLKRKYYRFERQNKS